MHPFVKDQSTEKGQAMILSEYGNWNRKGSCPTEIAFIFRKIEGYIASYLPNGLDVRSIPVDRLAQSWHRQESTNFGNY